MGITNFDQVQLDEGILLDADGNEVINEDGLVGVLYDADGNQVVGTQEDAIADITPATDGTTAGTAVNAILAVLRSHGLIATGS